MRFSSLPAKKESQGLPSAIEQLALMTQGDFVPYHMCTAVISTVRGWGGEAGGHIHKCR